MDKSITNINLKQDELDLKGTFSNLFKFWYLFVVIIPFCLGTAHIYLKYKSQVYAVSGTLLIRDKANKMGAENLIESLEILRPNLNIENETGILKSYSLIDKTIQNLDFDVSYFSKGRVKTFEIYKNSPYKVEFDTLYPQIVGVPFFIEFLTDSTFELRINATNFYSYLPFSNTSSENKVSNFQLQKIYNYGEVCTSKYFSFIVHKNNDLVLDYRKKIDGDDYFIIHSRNDLVNKFRQKLNINPQKRYSSILEISMEGILYKKDIDFINQLMNEYLNQSLEEKNQVATNTIRFIDEQIFFVSTELNSIEERLKNYREDNSFLDLNITANYAFQNYQHLINEKADLIVKDKYFQYLNKYINESTDLQDVIAPSSIGIDDPLLINLVNGLNRLYSEKAEKEFSVERNNPSIKILEDKIANARKQLKENLNSISKSSSIALNAIDQRLAEIDERLKTMPKTERDYIAIQRLFKLNEHIYNYLMEKKAEAGIAKASNIADHKIIDLARLTNNFPISPNARLVYISSFVIALFIIIFIISVYISLDDTINKKEDIESKSNIAILTQIGKYKSNEKIPVIEHPRSMIAESFRILRLNLKYLNKGKGVNVIGLTSTISGEGKTFCSLNLAGSLASAGAKTILIGADLRRPQLSNMLRVFSSVGLSNYLANDTKINEIISSTEVPYLDLICSGPIPPNPTELLESNKFSELINELKTMYEYIVIDSPPIGLVSDYMVIEKNVDVTLYIMRANYSKKEFIENINKLKAENSTSNFAIVLNDSERTDLGSYDYGYYEEQVKITKLQLLKRWLKI